MTAILPELLPDELLYSTIARWRDRLCPHDQKTVLEELFGHRTGIAVVDFPGRLDAFLARLPPQHPYEAESLLDRHTALPYYAPFIPSKRLAEVRDRLRRGGSSGIPDLLGIRASTIRVPQHLQFCPACANEDRIRFGEPYWHRCHQLPAVWVCPIHHSPLHASTIRRSGGIGRHIFRSLSSVWEEGTRELVPPCEGESLWRLIADDTAALLQIPSSHASGLDLRESYRNRLAELSLMRTSKQVRMTDLRDAFERHYSGPLLVAMGCGVRTMTGEDDWLARLVRKPRTTQHPLHHLLLMHFLGAGLADFVARGRPPRPVASDCISARIIEGCPNPVCPDAGIQRRAATRPQQSPPLECSACGMVYRPARHPAIPARVLMRGRVWDEKLLALVEDSAVSLREIARRLGVTTKAVQGHAKRLGVWRESWKASPRPYGRLVEPGSDSRTGVQRDTWLQLQADHPDEGVQELRERAPATYAHLYRRDRDWLMQNRPLSRRQGNARLQRVDWIARDHQMLTTARLSVQALRWEAGRPLRLTRTAIARRMGHLSLVEQHLDRMPQTRAFLASVVESRDEHARRKLQWAVSEFRKEGIAPAASCLIRRAGLRPDLAAQLARDVDQAVRSLSSGEAPRNRDYGASLPES